jgi:hypothetical protein
MKSIAVKVAPKGPAPGKIKVGEYSRYRKELKEQIVKEVMDDLFPKEDEMDLDEYVEVAGSEPKGNIFVEFLRFLGCLPVGVHEAVMNGSPEQLTAALKNLNSGEHKDPARVNKRDVMCCARIELPLLIFLKSRIMEGLQYQRLLRQGDQNWLKFS